MKIKKETGKGKGKKREKAPAVAPPGYIPFYLFGGFILPLLIPILPSSEPRKK